MKQTIRLTESEFKGLIKEGVRRILKEMDSNEEECYKGILKNIGMAQNFVMEVDEIVRNEYDSDEYTNRKLKNIDECYKHLNAAESIIEKVALNGRMGSFGSEGYYSNPNLAGVGL